MILEEVIIQHVRDALYETNTSEKADENTGSSEEMTDDCSALTEVDQHLVSHYQQVDPLLLAAFMDDSGTTSSPKLSTQKDSVTRYGRRQKDSVNRFGRK